MGNVLHFSPSLKSQHYFLLSHQHPEDDDDDDDDKGEDDYAAAVLNSCCGCCRCSKVFPRLEVRTALPPDPDGGRADATYSVRGQAAIDEMAKSLLQIR